MELLLLKSFAEISAYVGYVLIAILVLLAMITVHEFGHYISGKLLGFGIEEFSIGFGPALFKKKKANGEIFSVRLLPLGGFCGFKGEDGDSEDPTAFNNRAPWKRIIVLVSGALMNYLFALVLIIAMFGAYGQNCVYVGDVAPSEISSEYSLQKGDVILQADGKDVFLSTDLMQVLDGREAGEKVEFFVRRGGEDCAITVILRRDAKFANLEDVETLSLALGSYSQTEDGQYEKTQLYATGVKFGFFSTIGRSFKYSFKLAGTIFTVLGQLLTGKLGLGAVGGTVTTIGVTASAIQTGGVRYLLYIASFIGVNLAVFNLLPFPALDGSRVVFAVIEWIRKKPLNRKVEAIIHTVGFVLILVFAVVIDLQKCF